MGPDQVVGKYVRLEGLSRRHIPSLFLNLGLLQDKSVFDWLPWTDPTDTEDELWSLFERLRKNRGFIIYAIVGNPLHVNPRSDSESAQSPNNNKDEVLGTIGYLDINPQYRSLEVGAVLLSQSLRRSAAATEAHYLLLRNVCDVNASPDTLPYRRIAWKCNRLNTASRRAAERIGYTYEGTLRYHMISKGRSRDSDLLSIIDDEWPITKRSLQSWLDEANFNEHGKQKQTLEQIRAAFIEQSVAA